MKNFLILFLIILCTLCGCSKGTESILSTPVQKDPGALTVMNQNGFMGATVAGTSIDYTLSIKASGGLDLSNLNVSLTTSDPISFKGGSYPGSGGTCSTALKSGDTCTIILIYEPTTTNSHTAIVNFNYADVLKSYSKTFQVSADSNPILSFEYGTTYDFGNKFVGTSTDLRIRISNTGKVTAQSISVNNLILPFSMKGGSYPGTGGTCGSSLSPGQTCDLYVRYTPTSSGEHLQNITLTYLNAGRTESNTLKLLAWGFFQAELSVSDSSGYSFGTVATGMSHDKVFTITHSSGDVTASSIDVSGFTGPFTFKGGAFPGTGGTCARTLSKEKGYCTIVVSLTSEVTGTWNNVLTFSYFNGTNTITTTRSLSATTKLRAVISLSTKAPNFGVIDLDTSTSKTLTVTYVSGELPVTGIGMSGLTGYFNYSGGVFPGTGGTCGTTLSSGSCTISFSYFPRAYGIHTLAPTFTFDDGATAQSVAFSFEGKTASVLSTLSSTGFNNVVNGQKKDLSITLNVSAGNGVTGLSSTLINSPFSFKNGSFPGTGGTCTNTVSASSSCTIIITFAPTTEGYKTDTLRLSYNGGTSNKFLDLNLTGNSTPAANITIPDTNFGTTSVNSTKEMGVTITNSSTISPTSVIWDLPQGFSFKNGSFPGTGGNCWASTCTVVLVFNPTSASSYSGLLTVTYDDGAGTTKKATALLTGAGVPTNDLFLSSFDTVNFSSLYIGATKDISFTLSHGGGTTPANNISKSITTTDYTILNDNCPESLKNGETCTVTVRFSPLNSGTRNGAINVLYNNGSAKTVTRLFTGTGTPPALLTPSPAALSFGSLPTDEFSDLTIKITHSGTPAATSFTRTVSGAGFTKITDTCSSTLGSSGNCSVTIRFSPVAATTYSGTFSFSYNNGFTTKTTSVSLTGTGNPTADLKFSKDSYDFGKIIQTQSSTQTITISHSGPVAATGISFSGLSAPYQFKGGTYPGTGGTCGTTLSSGSCTLVIDFSPTNVGIKNQTLSLSYDNGTGARTKTTLLTGESLAQAIISVSESNPYNFGITNINGFIDKAFTLTNTGSVTGTDLSGSFDIGVFTFKDGSFPGTGGTCTTSLSAGSFCTIVLRFKPVAAVSYTGSFTLNYHDGLRVQTEYKNLTGTGSSGGTLQKYMAFLSEESKIEGRKVFVKNSSLWAMTSLNETALYKSYHSLIMKEKNLLSPMMEGLQIFSLDEDLDQDQFPELLFSIHNKDGSLAGHSIRSGRDGKVLIRYLGPKE